jgi:hypothetical protein
MLADFLLQVANLAAERGLRQMQSFGRTSEVQVFRNSNKVAQVPQLHLFKKWFERFE